MTPELTIQALFDMYDKCFETRFECLDYLLCVPNNNFEWRGGELVHTTKDLKPANELIHGRAEPRNRNKTSTYPKECARPIPSRWYFCYGAERDKNQRDNPNYMPIDLRKDAAHLWNFPENITDEWWRLICETMDELLRDAVIGIDDIVKNRENYAGMKRHAAKAANQEAKTAGQPAKTMAQDTTTPAGCDNEVDPEKCKATVRATARPDKPYYNVENYDKEVDPAKFGLTMKDAGVVGLLSVEQLQYAHAIYQRYLNTKRIMDCVNKTLRPTDIRRVAIDSEDYKTMAAIFETEKCGLIPEDKTMASVVEKYLAGWPYKRKDGNT